MDEEFDRKIRIALVTKIIGIIIFFSFNKFQNFLFLQTSSFSKLEKVRRVMNKRQLLLILARSGSEFRAGTTSSRISESFFRDYKIIVLSASSAIKFKQDYEQLFNSLLLLRREILN